MMMNDNIARNMLMSSHSAMTAAGNDKRV